MSTPLAILGCKQQGDEQSVSSCGHMHPDNEERTMESNAILRAQHNDVNNVIVRERTDLVVDKEWASECVPCPNVDVYYNIDCCRNPSIQSVTPWPTDSLPIRTSHPFSCCACLWLSRSWRVLSCLLVYSANIHRTSTTLNPSSLAHIYMWYSSANRTKWCVCSLTIPNNSSRRVVWPGKSLVMQYVDSVAKGWLDRSGSSNDQEATMPRIVVTRGSIETYLCAFINAKTCNKHLSSLCRSEAAEPEANQGSQLRIRSGRNGLSECCSFEDKDEDSGEGIDAYWCNS